MRIRRSLARFSSRLRRRALQIIAAPLEAPASTTVGLVAFLVVGFTWLTYAVGGTSTIPPHWFYIPIAIAGARFGFGSAALTAVVSGLAIGPLMPSEVASGLAQHASDWITRTVFFVAIGLMVTLLLRLAAREIIEERDHAASGRRLDNALRHGQLRLHFQPIVSAGTGEISGAEALIRWELPNEGLMPPDWFVPSAEQTGRIVPIGTWVIDEACAHMSRWAPFLGESRFVMSVNVAPAQLYHGDLAGTVLSTLERHGIDPSLFCLEITEGSVIRDLPEVIRVLDRLRSSGVSIAIDDFGRGLSSLSYLRDLPFDTIKIDGAFLERLDEDPGAVTVIDNVVRLATELDKHTVAERVETELQWRRLVDSGCSHGQGYLFSPPLPPAAFAALLSSRQVWPASRFKLKAS